MKISSIRKHDPAWHLIDAKDIVLGRLATQAANLLRGKGKVSFVLNMDCGDHVVVVNAGSIALTGNKLLQKEYFHYSGFHGGMKSKNAKTLMAEKPEELIVHAVKGMLPKTKLHGEWMKRLHVYADANHPHQANVAPLVTK